MKSRYESLVFGAHALARQGRSANMEPDAGSQKLGDREIAMLTGTFQFHLATVTPAGWPYIQYRSGPVGFVHHLGGQTIGFADHRGNRQFASVGNIETNGRAALFVADMPLRKRLKVIGTSRVVDAADDPELLEKLKSLAGGAKVAAQCERSIVIDVEAFDWNCSRSLVPQYTEDQVRQRVKPYIDQIAELRAEIAELKA